MIQLSGFADEIGPDLGLQIETLASENMKFLELRGVWDTNVLDLGNDQRAEVRERLGDAGIRVSSIGSPIGKVRIDEPWADHVERFKAALDAAEFFEAPYIRLFSYYPPEDGTIADHRDEVIRRLNEQVEMAAGRAVTLLHENEADIYGEKPDACLDLHENVPGLKAVFDPANFVQAAVKPAEAWAALKEHVVYFHIKDAVAGTGKVVPAGEGDGDIPEILREAICERGYSGFISLEPHLAVAGQFAGFSGPDLFKKAVQTLKAILDDLGAEYGAKA
ncbi:MAG TPA: sugar phosphate isomerase/epimerase family protein [Phycisphaerae bacterium]|nr:sugar phosphate isomerase/epimerase family protein [Phycisphaerae bacterium]